MGTVISLDVAGMAVDWAKNTMGADHGVLFQEADRKRIGSDQIDHEYSEEDAPEFAESEMGFSRSLETVVPRLELLGFTLERAAREYGAAVDTYVDERKAISDEADVDNGRVASFDEFRQYLSAHPVTLLDDTYRHELEPDEHERRIKDKLLRDPLTRMLPWYSDYGADAYSERSYFGNLLGFLHPYSLLRVLAESADNSQAPVVWHYGPLVMAGWAKEHEFVAGARRGQTFLIATEGSSDVHVLSHALDLLRPEVADFFRFIDVSERHPFSGTGNLVKFAEGLTKIDIQNQVVFVLDNDAEGVDACRRIRQLMLPPNMYAITLPELDEFRAFPAVGPEGRHVADINGRAAAIECYLDLTASGLPPPQVIWTNYRKEEGIYQGVLEHKEVYAKAFLKVRSRALDCSEYKLANINRVLDTVVAECCSIASASLALGVRKVDW